MLTEGASEGDNMFFSERILGTDSVLAEWHRFEPFMGDPLLGDEVGEFCRRQKGKASGVLLLRRRPSYFTW